MARKARTPRASKGRKGKAGGGLKDLSPQARMAKKVKGRGLGQLRSMASLNTSIGQGS